MNYSNCECTPAVVLSTKDPEHLGRIKCVIPGVLDNSTMSEENLPWIYPQAMGRYQSFSKPIEGQKVWIINNKANYNEYWYAPFFEYNEKTKEYLDQSYENNPEVIISRDFGENSALETFDDVNGFVTKFGNNHIVLEPSGRIECLNNGIQMEVQADAVKCGESGGSYEPTVKYTQLESLFNQLAGVFDNLETQTPKPYTSQYIGLFKQAASICREITKAKAPHCKVN